MSRAIGNGGDPKDGKGKGTTAGRPRLVRMERISRKSRANTDMVAGPPPKPLEEGLTGRMPRDTMEVSEEIMDHVRRALDLSRRHPNALIRAQNRLINDSREVPDIDIEGLFSSWSMLDYDRHMKETGHDKAVEILLRQVVEIHGINSSTQGFPIFGDRLLEMGCGTGTPILLLSQLLRPEEFQGMLITANDITKDMLTKARAKLRGMRNVRFTNKDITRKPDFGSLFHTVVLSQTLPFIADREILDRENAQGIENSEHVQTKLEVIREVFQRHLALNGYFLLIDEWPMKLTESTRNPMRELERRMALGSENSEDLMEEYERKQLIERQFYKVFRPIRERNTLYNKIFRRNEFGARFVAELKARIDREHSMYVMIYRRDEDKIIHRDRLLPWTQKKARDEGITLSFAEEAREMAVEKLLTLIRATDRHFVAHFTPINGEKAVWAELTPIDGTATYDSRHGELIEGRKYNTVILARLLHRMEPEERMKKVSQAVAALREGGALIVIEEWGYEKSAVPHGISKTDLRDKVMVPHRDRLVFEASFREPIAPGFDSGMYGYVYRRRY
ncbi:MAG: class I SAM-dependent methyltransferase [Candidatus Micrarchaeota archaeon]